MTVWRHLHGRLARFATTKRGVVSLFKSQLRLNLALQGGGAHGAFTWGVLDRLLEQDDLEIGWVSAASAGAINAVALADGLARGGPEAAREHLGTVWQAVYKAGVPDLLRLNPFLYGMSQSSTFQQMASLMSPYEFNPLGFDPLRKLLEEHVDFERLRSNPPFDMLISATDVGTGHARLFRSNELTIEMVLASACLPTVHHAIEIEGRAYWDGGFSSNPDIVTLGSESPTNDTLIVQLNPLTTSEIPTGIKEITAQVNQLQFNAPLQREVEIIETVRSIDVRRFQAARPGRARLARHRFHIIQAGRHTALLKPETRFKPDWTLFTQLHTAGRREAQKWLDRHGKDVGRRETVDLAATYLSPHQRQPVPPVSGEADDRQIGDDAASPT